jgi:hypothetical protein
MREQSPSQDEHIEEALRRYVAARQQVRQIGRRPLSSRLVFFLWCLRVYVVIMLLLVAVTAFTNIIHR